MSLRSGKDPNEQTIALKRATREAKRERESLERERKRLESARTRERVFGLLDRLRERNEPTPHTGVAGYLLRAQARILDEIRRPTRSEKGNQFLHESSGWRIAFEGRKIWLRDMKGLAYLHYLIEHQREDFAATTLVTVTKGHDPSAVSEDLPVNDDLRVGSAPTLRDRMDESVARKALQEIREEIERARALGDLKEAELQEDRMEALGRELKSSYGWRGFERDEKTPEARARKAVRMAISRAIAAIEKKHRSLAAHLNDSVKTGAMCSYEPLKPIDWQVTSSDCA
jgi:hypothetical protein